MMKKIAYFFFISITGLLFCNCTSKSASTPFTHARAIIEQGDTIPESGLLNPFVISGAEITPEILQSDYFVDIEKAVDAPQPDSELGLILHHDGSVIACKKRYISRLFPNASNFVVAGEDITSQQFDSIPAALLLNVTGKDNGQTLVISLRKDVNDPNPEVQKKIEEEHSWAIKNR